jgi:hypothetical protein
MICVMSSLNRCTINGVAMIDPQPLHNHHQTGDFRMDDDSDKIRVSVHTKAGRRDLRRVEANNLFAISLAVSIE